MGKHLVLAGAGHAHMVLLDNLRSIVESGFSVTVISPSPFHYYSGMGPGMLGGTYPPESIRFAVQEKAAAAGARFLLDRVQQLLPDSRQVKLESGAVLDYDVISCNIGSYVPQGGGTGAQSDVYPVKPIEKLQEAGTKIGDLLREKELKVAVIGGGPAAAEIAGNIWQIGRQYPGRGLETTIFARGRLLQRFPRAVQARTRKILQRRGILLNENSAVTHVASRSVRTAHGKDFRPDLIFLATGVKPSPVFRDSSLPVGPDGGLLTNSFLQSTVYPEIFGGGDCICFKDSPLDKVGVYAVRENAVLYHNVKAALLGRPLKTFDPGGDYLLIFNLGGREGVLHKKGLTLAGRPAWRLKDWIDRRFMKRFQ